jgi:hypothetical protein
VAPPDDIRTLAAMVSRQSLDLNVYAGFLLDALAGALPAEYVTVRRKRSIRRRGDDAPVLAVSVRLGEHRYSLERSSPASVPSVSVGHEVAGVVLSTQVLPLDEWSYRLATALADLARHNLDVTAALQRITTVHV